FVGEQAGRATLCKAKRAGRVARPALFARAGEERLTSPSSPSCRPPSSACRRRRSRRPPSGWWTGPRPAAEPRGSSSRVGPTFPCVKLTKQRCSTSVPKASPGITTRAIESAGTAGRRRLLFAVLLLLLLGLLLLGLLLFLLVAVLLLLGLLLLGLLLL